MSLKAKIEAILFMTDKPIKAQAIARIVNEDVQLVRQSVLELIHDYEGREGGLEIADDNGYIIQVKDRYASIIDEFAPMEIPISLVRTLSAIAIKQPVPQSEIIRIRGAGAYDHIKELIERELIVKKDEGGRSPILSTTKAFQEYFRLSQDAKSLRTELKKQDKKNKAAEEAAEAAEAGDGQMVLPIGQLEDAISAGESAKASDTAAESGDNVVPLPAATAEEGDEGGSPDAMTRASEQLDKIYDFSPDASLTYTPPPAMKTEAEEVESAGAVGDI